MYEPSELERGFFTERDNDIRVTDVPERFQVTLLLEPMFRAQPIGNIHVCVHVIIPVHVHVDMAANVG